MSLEEEAAAGARGRPGQEGLDDGVGGDVLLHGFTILFSHLFFAFTSFQYVPSTPIVFKKSSLLELFKIHS